jgi:hypothetical protein
MTAAGCGQLRGQRVPSYRHLDGLFMVCDRELVTLVPQVVAHGAELVDPAG